MRKLFQTGLLALLLFGSVSLAAEDPKVAAQKKAAQENWAALDLGEPVHHETPNLLLYASKSEEAKLKDMGVTLEKYYAAAKAVQLDAKKEMWPGKLTVYLFADRDEFTSYLRRVEKRRLDEDETGLHTVEGDFPRVAAGPPRSKQTVNLAMHAGEQIAAALLQRKAGVKTPLPDWLMVGFGRATSWRVHPRDKATSDARREALVLVVNKQRTAQQVWSGSLEAAEATVLRPTLADLMAYGPGSSRFPAFVTGFRPDEGQERRSTEQALEAAGIKSENLAKVWPEFVRNPR
jgi:hypothetical protein